MKSSGHRRKGFKELMAACEAGKVDLVLTKSIKRFARNTVDLISAIRHLKDIGVEVIFEQENISTFSPDGDFMLTVLASFAQEESRSLSENIKWTWRKKMENGEPVSKPDCYGYRWDGVQYQIVPQEAEVVKRVFHECLRGDGLIDIARRLNAEGIPTAMNASWTFNTVRLMLRNFSYTGNLILQKYVNVAPNVKRENKGKCDQFVVPDTHEPIVTYDEWEEVQSLLKNTPRNPEDPNIQRFKGKIFCHETGMKYWHNAGYWHRKDKVKGSARGVHIAAPDVPMYALEEAVMACERKGSLMRIEVKKNQLLDFYFTDGEILDYRWERHKSIVPASVRAKQGKAMSIRDTATKKGINGTLCCFMKDAESGRNYTLHSPGKRGNRYYVKGAHKPGVHEWEMQDLIVDLLGLESFDEAVMDQYLTHCTIDGKDVTFYFRDGHQERRQLK